MKFINYLFIFANNRKFLIFIKKIIYLLDPY